MFDNSESDLNGFLLKGYLSKYNLFLKMKKYLFKHKQIKLLSYIIFLWQFTSPKINLYGELNETFNSADFTTDETSLTIGRCR